VARRPTRPREVTTKDVPRTFFIRSTGGSEFNAVPAALENGMAPHNIMAFVKHLLVVGCLCRFALRTQHGIRFGRAKEQ
jgi:hypothetical protein